MSRQPTDDRSRGTADGGDDRTETDESTVDRRSILRLAGGAAAAGATGIGAFAGSAAAWDRFDVDFKGCSEVWLIVGEDDLHYHPPTTAKVVVASGVDSSSSPRSERRPCRASTATLPW
ncbi:MAG: hypothetical protein ABEI99_11580, partial [Halobaculum sp.]